MNHSLVALLHDPERGISLRRDRQLGQDLLTAAPDGVKEVGAQAVGPLRIRPGDDLDLRRQRLVQPAREVGVLAQRLHDRGQRDALLA